jgi:hypothetical protein
MRKMAAAFIATVPIAGTAVAGEPPDFTTVDQDKNGYISRDEARSAPELMQIFASVDTNRDGQLSTAEFMEAVKQLRG